MYSASDPRFMHLALELGRQALLHATPNPRVGCVIVRGDQVLGQGYTQAPGGNHAEIEALQDARRSGHDVQGAAVYVTLEPCSHFGRTPPCANALIEARVGRVVAAVEDPNPQVAGRGMAMLRGAGIDVRCGLLRQEAIEANLGFFMRMQRGRPWVRLKIAATLDGRTALANGAARWITGPAARADGHAWRARACALLTGSATVRADDPLLTVREVATPRQPLRVVADSSAGIAPTARLFDGNPVLIASAHPAPERSEFFAAHNAEVYSCPGPDGRVDLSALLVELGRRGINEVQVEAGPTLGGALLGAGLVDELLLYLAPILVGPGRPLLALPPLEDLAAGRRLQFHGCSAIGPDLRILARVN